MNIEQAAKKLEALGNPSRLKIFRLLVRAGVNGMPVGEIQKKMAIPGSTLSHHISKLQQTELVNQERNGRVLTCRASYSEMENLLHFITENCCVPEK